MNSATTTIPSVPVSRFSLREWLAARSAVLCLSIAFLVATLHWTMAITAVSEKSPTFDEPLHLTAGYSYWLRNDFRLNPENGNLPQRWAALPLLLSNPQFVSTTAPSWVAGSEGRTGHEFSYELGNNFEELLLRGRMMIALFSATLCLLIYIWSKELFGTAGGLISICAAAFCPTLLAHGALVTSDVTVTLFMTASVWSFWRMLQRLTPRNVMLCALCVAGLFVAKMSGPLILPMMAIMLLVRLLSCRPLDVRFGTAWEETCRWRQALLFSGALTLIGVAVLVAIWASFCFRYSALDQPETYRTKLNKNWEQVLDGRGAIENTIAFARNHRLLPEAYLYGMAFVQKNASRRMAFLDGRFSVYGFPEFFPMAFLYKTPLPTMGLLFLAGTAIIISLGRASKTSGRLWTKGGDMLYRATPLLVLVVIYGAFALSSHLNIGHRHILPLYPSLFVGCGYCAYYFRNKALRAGALAVSLLVLWQVKESIYVRPDYLAYFNQFAGGPGNGYKHLVDSSLDWGQDLPALKRWLDERPSVDSRRTYLAYFGTADPAWYGVHAVALPQVSMSGGKFLPLTGGLYCVSATTLQQVYSRAMGRWSEPYEKVFQNVLTDVNQYLATANDPTARAQLLSGKHGEYLLERFQMLEVLRLARLCATLRHREPVGSVGHSILIFDLSDAEVHEALFGPPAELFPRVGVIGAD